MQRVDSLEKTLMLGGIGGRRRRGRQRMRWLDNITYSMDVSLSKFQEQNGLRVGAYIFSQAITVEEAVQEADFLLEILAGKPIDGPVVFDWEVIGTKDARTYGLDTDTLCAAANAFCRRIEQAGYSPMIYFNSYAGYVKYDLSEIMEYPFWFAQYKEQPDFYYNFQMWQYTSSGKVNGIDGNVDLDVWMLPND